MTRKNFHYKKMVDKRLRIRQQLFFLIVLILFGINIYNVFLGKISLMLGTSGFFLAFVLGIGLSRIFKIAWDTEKNKVIGQLDRAGVILLVLYIGVELGRNWIFHHWLDGAALNAFGLIILTGLLGGRYLGTQFLIHKRILQRGEASEQGLDASL